MSDVRAARAREAHAASLAAVVTGNQHREVRDHLVRSLRREDPAQWTYARLAQAVGCSPELIAVIIRSE